MWTFDVDYVTQNNITSKLRIIVINGMRVFYDSSELRDQRQTSTRVPSYGTNAS